MAAGSERAAPQLQGRLGGKRATDASCGLQGRDGRAILPCVPADDDADLTRLLPPARVISTRLWLVVHRDLSCLPRVRSVMKFLAAIAPRRGRQRR